MLGLTVPTRGDHPELLQQLIVASGIPPERVVIVRTAPSAWVPEGVRVVDDSGPINIHRWWNRGIAACESLGASRVAVLNDDIVVQPGALQTLSEALNATDADVATPGDQFRVFRGPIPRARVLIGSLWVLDVTSPLRPAEDYRWFYGDDDLDVRARRRFGGVVTVPVEYEHRHAGEATDASSLLTGLMRDDRKVFRRRHPADYAFRVAYERSQGRTGKWLRSLLNAPGSRG